MKELKRLSTLKGKLMLFLAVAGPGIITGNVDNDAGGIATYSAAGARFGFRMLWLLLIITFSLAVIQEMCARMGTVTGKGLGDLIRETFGIRLTVITMVALLVANMANTAGEFAGIAAGFEIFGISRYIAVPLSALGVWWLVVRGSYRVVERFYMMFCVLFATYVISGVLARPDWRLVLVSTFKPDFSWDPEFVVMAITLIGTTIAPWMQFYQQSAIRDKGLTARDLPLERLDTYIGSFLTNFVAFFIVTACATVLFPAGIRVETADQAAAALRPLAGDYCGLLFAAGLVNASLMAASILPLTTAYAIAESLGFEGSLEVKSGESKAFYWLYTLMVAVGAATVMVPRVDFVGVMLFSQTINGILLPLILYVMLKIVNDREIMGAHVNTRLENAIAGAQAVVLVVLTAVMVWQTIIPR
ncbi:MAG: Nramp family divalent metal transporter [Firmicutes bacterium]|nr:Nramp family divalent metal transporter [Bacillota bacterium]